MIDFHRQMQYGIYHYDMQYVMVDIRLAYKAGKYQYCGKSLFSTRFAGIQDHVYIFRYCISTRMPQHDCQHINHSL